MENLKASLGSLGLNDADIVSICSMFRFKEYAKNEYLLREGQMANKIFFIEKGSVILGDELEDKFVTRHLAKEKEFVTSLASFSKETVSREFLKTLEPSHIYAMSKKDFDLLLQRYPTINQFFQQVIFDTLIKCQQRITDLISLDAKEYYQDILQNHPEYILRMPQYDLASYMGIEPQSLSRLKKASE
ncbi:MAG: Crp/Fnr family transcriptional regulator [Chitinophagaceae bacterium]|nr:Crp/Fnr family transcriptional regulator [Chitinophagaceae bacterium]